MSHALAIDSVIPPVVEKPVVERQKVLHSLELLRFVSAAGIVWCHINPPKGLFVVSPLPMFLVLTSVLAVGSLQRSGPQRFLSSRLRRIAVPWVAWSIFYMFVNMALHRDWRGPMISDSALSFLIGSTIHLWFLPFVLLISVPIALFVPLIEDATGLIIFTAILVPLSVLNLHLHANHALPDPFGQWTFSFSSVCLGILLALGPRHNMRYVAFVYVMLVAALGVEYGSIDDAGQLITAILVYEFLSRVQWNHVWMLQLGRLSFGLYLLHPFFMLVYYKFFAGTPIVFGVGLVIVLTCITTLMLLRIPYLRKLV